MKNWKNYLLLTVSLALSVPAAKWLYACAGGEDPYDYFASFFLNDINKDPAYQPFRYTSYLTYYDDWWDPQTDKDTVLPDQNITEWQAYLGNKVNRADIDSFVYRFSYDDLKALYGNLEKGSKNALPRQVETNSMTQWFKSTQDLEALGYLMYAKQCEPQVSDGGDNWNTPEKDSARMNKLIKNGLQLHAASKIEFFQWRYSFQVLRLAFYSGQNKKTLELYDRLIGDKADTTYIYARVLGLKAGALFRIGKKQQAAYLYTRVFDLSDDMKRSAHISFNWAVNADSKKVLPLCKNDHEKAVVYIMDALYKRNKEAVSNLELMQNAYALDPDVRGLDVVMTRAINELEAAFLDEKLRQNRSVYSLSGYGNYYEEAGNQDNKNPVTTPAFAKQIQELALFAAKVGSAKNNGDPAFWYLAEAYLHLLNQEPKAANAALAQAEKLPLTARQKDQANIIRALYFVYQKPTLTAASEEELLPLLEWLQQKKAGDDRLANVYRYLMNGVLAQAYLSQKDTTKMVLSLSKLGAPEPFGTRDYGDGYVDYYAEDFTDEAGRYLQSMSMAQLASTKAFVAKGGSSAFDRWLISSNLYSPSVLSEMEGTRYLRALDFQKAIRAFEQVKASELKQRSLPDPFVLHIRDIQEWDQHDSANSYTKLRFAQEMYKLQQEVSNDPAAAQKQFLYGLGLYGMTYYGRASHAFTYYRSGSDGFAFFNSTQREKLNKDYQNYYGATAAAAAFKAAANATDDPELKAKSIYMLAMCWQKNVPDPPRDKYGYASGEENYYLKKAKNNPFFNELTALSATTFYKTVSTRCSYLQDYIRRKR